MTLEPDVAEALKKPARGKPRPARAYRINPVPLGGAAAGIDLDRALRLADAMKDEAQARKLKLRK